MSTLSKISERKRIVILSILITVLFAVLCMIDYARRIPPAMDKLEVVYQDSENVPKTIVCLNDKIQAEEWYSPEPNTEVENSVGISIADKESIDSLLFDLYSDDNNGIYLQSVSFFAGEETFYSVNAISLMESIEVYNANYQTIEETFIEFIPCDASQQIRIRMTEEAVSDLNQHYAKFENQFNHSRIIHYIQIWIILLVACYWWVSLKLGKLSIEVIKNRRADRNKQNSRYKWIDYLRGMAIIAVVVCHQQHFLHDTEILQMLSVYSVTTFVFCMGITKYISINSFVSKGQRSWGLYIVKSVKKTVCEYLLATVCYSIVSGNTSYGAIFSNIINFSASGPLYFVNIFIILSVFAPLIYCCLIHIKNISSPSNYNVNKAVFLLTLFICGYILSGFLCTSVYVFIYALGMCMLIDGEPGTKIGNLIGSVALFLVGLSGLLINYPRFLEGKVGLGLDQLVNKLGVNPPNITTIIYSLGCIALFYQLFNIKWVKKSDRMLLKPLELLGKYSLDIFVWHLLIQRFFITNQNMFRNIWVKRICCYLAMLFLPIIIRKLYDLIKNRAKLLLSRSLNN